jgi:hypothetical protein
MILEELKDWIDKSIAANNGNLHAMSLIMVRDKIRELEATEIEPECHCSVCGNLVPCYAEDWAVTCDKDGINCDNYIPIN